jgi:hypothetical protein
MPPQITSFEPRARPADSFRKPRQGDLILFSQISSIRNEGRHEMRGFKEHGASERFCREHDELRTFLRSRSRHNEYVSATRRRRRFLLHARLAMRIMRAA